MISSDDIKSSNTIANLSRKPLHLLDLSSQDDTAKTPLYNRNWLTNLIVRHSSDPRLKEYYEDLHVKYPILINKALVVAPMVDQSDLPFRLLCRDYGSNLCFTPMVHAKVRLLKNKHKVFSMFA